MPLERVDNNSQVFLVVQGKKGGETKPFLIPDFVSIANYDGSVEDEQEIGGATDACIILRPSRKENNITKHEFYLYSNFRVAWKANIFEKKKEIY